MTYISLYLFFISIFYLFLEIESFTPAGRLAHSSVLVGSKLYYFGGVIDRISCSNEMFYLDVSQPFNIALPPWNDLTVNEGIPIKSCWGTVSLSVANNEQNIYLFGGFTDDIITDKDAFTSLVYKFNIKSGRWEIPIIKGKAPERRRGINAISDNSGKIYIFGGNNFNLGSSITNHFNDMVIFDVGELSWSISQFNAPAPRSEYSATLLSNGVIVYIGGYRHGSDGITLQIVDISQISLYDTNTLTWSEKIAKLIDQIESRRGHTALLTSNGKIIIYGGGKLDYAQVTPDIAVLNTETFEWSAPIVSSNIGKIPSLNYHTANLVGNYMIAAFGNITQSNAEPLAFKNANIYIMDIRNYTWVKTMTPAKTTNSSENPSDANSQLPIKVVIGVVVGAIFGTAAFMTAGFFGYKWYQRKSQNAIMRIHGNI